MLQGTAWGRSHGRALSPLGTVLHRPSIRRWVGPWEAQCVVMSWWVLNSAVSTLFLAFIVPSSSLHDAHSSACDSSPRCPLVLRSPCSFLNKSESTFEHTKASCGRQLGSSCRPALRIPRGSFSLRVDGWSSDLDGRQRHLCGPLQAAVSSNTR